MKKFLLSLIGMAAITLSASALSYTVDPAPQTVLPKSYGNWASMSFTFNFDVAPTVGSASGVKLWKNAVNDTEVLVDDSWQTSTSNGGKTVTVYGMDWDGYTCMFQCFDTNYYLVVPASVFGTDEDIVIEYYGLNAPAPANPLTLVTADPAPNTVLPQNSYSMVNMTFNLTFDRALASVNTLNIALRESNPDNGFEIDPMNEWNATLSGDKTSVNIWGSDYDGFTDYFFARDITYYLVIPAGAIVAADDATNEEAIVLEYYGKEQLTAIEGIGTANVTEVGRYSIDGKRVDANHSGVVIVKMSDGSTMKMVVR